MPNPNKIKEERYIGLVDSIKKCDHNIKMVLVMNLKNVLNAMK